MILNLKDFSRTQKKAFENVLGGAYDVYHISEVLPDYLYVCYRALTANIPNMNWDQFDTDELNRHDEYLDQKVYETFNGKSIFTNHQSNKVENSIGVIFDSIFNQDNSEDQFVDIIFGIDKEKAGDISRGVETKRLKSGSMGCQISHSLCSACGKEIWTESDVCDHLKNHRGQIIDGVRVAEKLRGVVFNEYSIVTVGADPKAQLRYIVSSIINYKRLPKVANDGDIFTLMQIIAQEVKNASFSEKLQVSKSLDDIIASLEGQNLKIIPKNTDVNLDDHVEDKLNVLFQYVRDSQIADLGGPVERKAEINFQSLVGKDVEIDERNQVTIL